jgi:hypothetical protein
MRLWHALPLPSAWHMRADRMREACRLRLNPGAPPCRQQQQHAKITNFKLRQTALHVIAFPTHRGA